MLTLVIVNVRLFVLVCVVVAIVQIVFVSVLCDAVTVATVTVAPRWTVTTGVDVVVMKVVLVM